MPIPEDRFLKSRFYEQLTEHVFISELLQEAWFSFNAIIEISRSEVDASGYDLILDCNGVLRHVQLKSSDITAKSNEQDVHISLSKKASGCIVWIVREEDQETKRLRLKYFFYGGKPGDPITISENFKRAKHTRADSQGIKKERPNVRRIPKSKFQNVTDPKELLQKLFELK